MRNTVSALLLCLMASSTAAACSMPSSSSMNGTFHVLDLSTHDSWSVQVARAGYDAECRLANSYDFDGSRFVWLESGGEGVQVFYSDLTTGSRAPLFSSKRIHDLDLEGSVLYWHYYSYDQGSSSYPTSRVHRYDLMTRSQTAVPISSPDPYEGYLLEDGRAIWVESSMGSPERLNVYDMENAAWIVRNRTWGQLGLPDQHSAVAAAGGDWLVISFYGGGQPSAWAYDVKGGKAHNVTSLGISTDLVSIDAGMLYWAGRYPDAGGHLFRAVLPDGIKEDVSAASSSFASDLQVRLGRAVFGSLHASELTASPTPPTTTTPGTTTTIRPATTEAPTTTTMRDPDERPERTVYVLPSLPLAVVLVVVSAVLAFRRRPR